MLRKPKRGNLKKWRVFLLVVLLLFGIVVILPKPAQNKVTNVIWDIPLTVYRVVAKPVLSSCFFQESKLSTLLETSQLGMPINPNCFIDEAKLKSKIQAGLPSWARKQIEEDLKNFSNITKNDLNQYEVENSQSINSVARFQIRDKKVVCKANSDIPSLYEHPRDVMKLVLGYLAEHEYIADTDFILALSDFFLPVEKKPVPIFTFSKDLNIPIEREQILMPDWQRLSSKTKSALPFFKEKNARVQWFYKGIKPYVHYVPVTSPDSIVAGKQWAEESPERVQSIIHDAEMFVENNLSLEDMYHYIIGLLEEYNKKRTEAGKS